MKQFLIAAICLLPLASIAQEKATPVKPKKAAVDSITLPLISVKDLNDFITVLKKSASYEQYIKLTPELVLGELVHWKVEQLKPKPKAAAKAPAPVKDAPAAEDEE